MALRRSPPPSDESRTELYDRTCGNNVSDNGNGGRARRSRPPDFIPEKRLKQDALRLSFVGNKEIIKAHCTHHLAAIDGAQTLAGLESALTAWVAAQCDRPLGQELSREDENRFAKNCQDPGVGCWLQVQGFLACALKECVQRYCGYPLGSHLETG